MPGRPCRPHITALAAVGRLLPPEADDDVSPVSSQGKNSHDAALAGAGNVENSAPEESLSDEPIDAREELRTSRERCKCEYGIAGETSSAHARSVDRYDDIQSD